MVRHALVAGFACLSLAACASGCGNVDSSSGGVNAPCTRDYDCAGGLSCVSGVCAGPVDDASSPAEAGTEAGLDAGGDG